MHPAAGTVVVVVVLVDVDEDVLDVDEDVLDVDEDVLGFDEDVLGFDDDVEPLTVDDVVVVPSAEMDDADVAATIVPPRATTEISANRT